MMFSCFNNTALLDSYNQVKANDSETTIYLAGIEQLSKLMAHGYR